MLSQRRMTIPYGEPIWEVIPLMLSQRRMTFPSTEPMWNMIPLMLSQRRMPSQCGMDSFYTYMLSQHRMAMRKLE